MQLSRQVTNLEILFVSVFFVQRLMLDWFQDIIDQNIRGGEQLGFGVSHVVL